MHLGQDQIFIIINFIDYILVQQLVGLLINAHSEFTKFCCFFVMFGSRVTDQHYVKNDCDYEPEEQNFFRAKFFNPTSHFLLHLIVKFSFFNEFVKVSF